MADPTTPVPPAPDKKPKQVHHDLNQADLTTLSQTEQMVLNAQKDPYKAAILEEDAELTEAWSAAMAQLIVDTRTGQQTHKEGRADVHSDTKDETTIKDDLIELINEIRPRAKITYGKTAPEKLPLYSVGVNLRVSRAVLEAAADGIITELGKDTVLKISAAKLQSLKDLTKAYKDANVTQSSDNVGAKLKQVDVKANLATVVAGRQKIRVAINGAYKYTDPASAAHRVLFGLPPNKPFNPGLGTTA